MYAKIVAIIFGQILHLNHKKVIEFLEFFHVTQSKLLIGNGSHCSSRLIFHFCNAVFTIFRIGDPYNSVCPYVTMSLCLFLGYFGNRFNDSLILLSILDIIQTKV